MIVIIIMATSISSNDTESTLFNLITLYAEYTNIPEAMADIVTGVSSWSTLEPIQGSCTGPYNP